MSTASLVKAARDGRGETVAPANDPEQLKKQELIIELLLAAGYFRARIAGLSPFDKVIGGLSWCITNSQVDVDIDLFFQEEANIGLQIKLGEAIEKSLLRMRCPYALQSHQIRGLDFVNIYPVIQWLVKKVIETREETGDLLRLYAEAQFGRDYSMPSDAEFELRKKPASEFVKTTRRRYRPNRRLRRRETQPSRDEEEAVQATLLEYGQKAFSNLPRQDPAQAAAAAAKKGRFAKLEAALGGGAAAAAGGDADAERAVREAEERRFASMLDAMEQTSGRAVSGSKLLGLFEAHTDDLLRMDSQLDVSRQQALAETGMSTKQYEEMAHARHIESLQRQIAAMQAKLAEAEEPRNALQEQVRALETEVAKKAALNRRIQEEIAKMDALETDENRQQIAQLRSLVMLNENLKRQEEQFLANCKRQLASLKEKIKELQNEKPDDEHLARGRLIQETFDDDKQRLSDARAALAKKIRDIAMVERRIDDIPSRSELQQYQLQFIELYEQVAVKLTETRQYYQAYNALNDQLTFLSKEISILNSVQENYKMAMKSKQMKEKFNEQLQSIVKSVEGFIEKTDRKLSDDRDKIHELNQKYLQQLERERSFYKMTSDFEEECRRNESLQTTLAELQQQPPAEEQPALVEEQ